MSRKSIANFKLREGHADRLQGDAARQRMYEFLDRLVSLALPRVRDFRGLNPNAFDGHGNYSLGLTEQLVFPGVESRQVHAPQGMNITIVITGAQRRRIARIAARHGHAVQGRGGERQRGRVGSVGNGLRAVPRVRRLLHCPEGHGVRCYSSGCVRER